MSDSTIDIYAGPERSHPPSLAYMLAVMAAAERGAPVQCYSFNGMSHGHGRWVNVGMPSWSWNTHSICERIDYRIDPASRPAPTMRKIPLTPNDLTGGAIWMRWNKDERSAHFLVVWIGQEGVTTCLDHIRSFEWLSETGAEWSTDRQVWHPFWKEIQA